MGLLKQLMGEEPFFWQDMAHYGDNTGEYGEWLIEFALNKKTIPGRFFVLRNVYVPWKGKTAEIDVLMLHERGIFVFESKNYSGKIYGKADDLQWSQYENGHKNHFYNPIRQNQTHIVALSEFLGIPPDQMTSYVVFSDRCKLMKVPDSTDKVVLIHRGDLVRELRYDLRRNTIVFTGEQIENIRNTLKQVSAGCSREEHIQDLKEKCPYCGAPLVKQFNKKTGYPFWGCSTYPRCQFIRNMGT